MVYKADATVETTINLLISAEDEIITKVLEKVLHDYCQKSFFLFYGFFTLFFYSIDFKLKKIFLLPNYLYESNYFAVTPALSKKLIVALSI